MESLNQMMMTFDEQCQNISEGDYLVVCKTMQMLYNNFKKKELNTRTREIVHENDVLVPIENTEHSKTVVLYCYNKYVKDLESKADFYLQKRDQIIRPRLNYVQKYSVLRILLNTIIDKYPNVDIYEKYKIPNNFQCIPQHVSKVESSFGRYMDMHDLLLDRCMYATYVHVIVKYDLFNVSEFKDYIAKYKELSDNARVYLQMKDSYIQSFEI